MALILGLLTKKEIQKHYSHHGYLYGIVPIYFNENDNAVAVRNGCPDFLLGVFDLLFEGYCVMHSLIDETFEPMFPIKLVGKITPDNV